MRNIEAPNSISLRKYVPTIRLVVIFELCYYAKSVNYNANNVKETTYIILYKF